MCEVCEVYKRVDKVADEMSFRFEQYQRELEYGNAEKAMEAKTSAEKCLARIFALLQEAQEVRSALIKSGRTPPVNGVVH